MTLTPEPTSTPSFHAELQTLISSAKHHLNAHGRPCYRRPIVPKPPVAKKEPPPSPPPKPEVKRKTIELQPLKAASSISSSSILNDLGVPTLNQPPSDRKARRIRDSWKERSLAPTIAVLMGPEESAERMLLQNIARAIDTLIAPCRAIPIQKLESENTWDHFFSSDELKHVIASDRVLSGNLLTHLREIPAENSRSLGGKPLLLLPDLSLYLKDPLLKASLWKMLCAVLRPSS